jgi:hypothetical protein
MIQKQKEIAEVEAQ